MQYVTFLTIFAYKYPCKLKWAVLSVHTFIKRPLAILRE